MKNNTLKTKSIRYAIAIALGGASLSANSAITTSTNLNFNSGAKNVECFLGGTPPDNCTLGITTVTVTGSWFAMDNDGNGLGTITTAEIRTINATGPIHIGTTNTVAGGHPGTINGSETPAFDIWEAFGNTGMHFIDSPISVVNDLGTTKELDFSGWSFNWAGTSTNMGGGIQDCGTATDGICVDNFGTDIAGTFDNGSGLATIVCSSASCSDNSTFVLDYAAVIPQAASELGGIAYALHLEGSISASGTSPVPVPAAAWLFASGLAGLASASRRRQG